MSIGCPEEGNHITSASNQLVGKVKHCQLEHYIANQESCFSNKGSKHSLGIHSYIHSQI